MDEFTKREKQQLSNNLPSSEAYRELSGAQAPRQRGEHKVRQAYTEPPAPPPKAPEPKMAPTPPPVEPPPPKKEAPKKVVHPALDELKEALGILPTSEKDLKHKETITTNSGKEITFTLRAMPKHLVAWANTIAARYSKDEQDYAVKITTTLASAAVSHINEAPLKEVFSVEEAEWIGDEVAAAHLFEFLMYQARDEVDIKIYKAYQKYIESEVSIVSALDVIEKDYKTYTCPKCDHKILEAEGVYWCYRCPNTKLVNEVKETDLPLA